VVLITGLLACVQLIRPLPDPHLVLATPVRHTFAGEKPSLPWPDEGQASVTAVGAGAIGRSGEQKPVPIASVAKAMTAYIIMRDHPLQEGKKGPLIGIDRTAAVEGQRDRSNNESTLNTVREGDRISQYDAIAALMIPSANNIARLLARWDSGSLDKFVDKMNRTAEELGMSNTTYTDPSGLDATTVSTAEDQVKLGLKIVQVDRLLDITRLPSWEDPSGRTWTNWNRLVPYNGALGIKTGTTTRAGGNLLWAAEKRIGDTDQLIVGAVLGQHRAPIIDTVLAASKRLMLATRDTLESRSLARSGEVVAYLENGLGERVPLVATKDVQVIGWPSRTTRITLTEGGRQLPRAAASGTVVGTLSVGTSSDGVEVPVALQKDLTTPSLIGRLTRIG
jgi:D-alanyl-D-alanine carboxypeptidase